jgi:hypothetical protein
LIEEIFIEVLQDFLKMLFSLLCRLCCRPSHVLQTAIIIIVVLFIFIGALIFQALEKENAIAVVEKEKEIFLKCIEQQVSVFSKYYESENIYLPQMIAKNCFRSMHGQWNFAASVLFAFSVVTTIGKEKFVGCGLCL